jgi:hypothetical protein
MNNNITFCIVDDIDSYANSEIKSTIKNIFDFTISNLYTKGYKTLVGKDENNLLKQVTTKYAVVMSPGTEYINGTKFFEAIERLIKQDFFIAGHILDRSSYDAYYELHHQCYVINLETYRKLGCPIIGHQELNAVHTQEEPLRSDDNYHDFYTPLTISRGWGERQYTHKCHGWNILSIALAKDLPVLIFDESIRNNKKHYYPESVQDYYKHSEYIDYKFNYCKEEFVHTDNTEWTTGINETYEQLVLPASGILYLDLIKKGRVVFYDYNQKALDYWQTHCPRNDNIEYVFVHTDLLNELSIIDYINPNLKTLVNLSNIFCYEGTVAKYSLEHRILAEENLVKLLKEKIKNISVNFTLRANTGH